MIGHDGPMEPILIVLGIILVIVIGGGLWLYAGRRRGQVSDEISAHQPMSVEDLLPSEGEDTDEDAEGAGAAKPAATLESPESIPGRMQRLRARLAEAAGTGQAGAQTLHAARDGLRRFQRRNRLGACLLYTSPSPRDKRQSRMPSSA